MKIHIHPSPSRLSVVNAVVRIQNSAGRSLQRLAQSASKLNAFALATLLYCGLAAPAAMADTGTLYSLAADAQVSQLSGTNSVSGQTSAYLNVGAYWNTTQMDVVYMFQIPTALVNDTTQVFTAANFSVMKGADALYLPTWNADLYGLGYSTTTTVDPTDFYEGTLDPANTLIQDSLLTPSIPANTIVSSTNATLINYLNNVLAAARDHGDSTVYVFFRINPKAYLSKGAYYILGMNEAGGSAVPSLSYTSAPVSDWQTVPLGGGGRATGIIAHPIPGGPIYGWTNVGGAFRWQPAADGTNGKWIQLTDKVISPVPLISAKGLQGINSMAVDPNDINKVYFSGGDSVTHGIYVSSDQGANWKAINTAIPILANIGGDSYGERLAVDPNNSNILWYGSNYSGLYQGVLSGTTWTFTLVPTASVPVGTGSNGVTFVACDKNNGSTIVYAGVFDGTNGGVFCATSGTNWIKLTGTNCRPAHGQVASDGTLYVTYGDGWAGTYGAVAKLARGSTTLTTITPPYAGNHAYCGLAVDPNNPLNVTVCEMNPGDTLWRTVTGGTTWNQLARVVNATEPDGTACVTRGLNGWNSATSLVINPQNSNELWAADMLGFMRTTNLTSGTTQWYNLQKNEEEVCVLALKSAPTGAVQLMTGIADVGGYYYYNPGYRPTGTTGAAFSGPLGSVTSLDFCEADPNIWVGGWDNSIASDGSGAISTDDGQHWLLFGELAENRIPRGTAAGWDTWDLTPYLSQHTNQVVTFVLISKASPSNTTALNYWSKETDSTDPLVTTSDPKLVINGSTTKYAVADTYVYGATACTGSNYGTATTLAVSYAWTAGNVRWTFVKFDLTGVNSITSANLSLYRSTVVPATSDYTVGVFGCADTSWGETTITYANRPPTYASSWTNGDGDIIDDYEYDPYYYASYSGQGSLKGGRIVMSATNANRLVWLSEGTLPPYYSTDRGATWTASTGGGNSTIQSRWIPSPQYQPLASDRVNGNKFYQLAGAGSGGYRNVYRSDNGGATWSVVGSVGGGIYTTFSQIAAAPGTEGDLWVADNQGGLFRSTDSGGTWIKKTGPSSVYQVSFGKAQSGSGYSVFIEAMVSGTAGIYISDDYGVNGASSWKLVSGRPTGQQTNCISGDRQTYGRVYVGTSGRGTFMH